MKHPLNRQRTHAYLLLVDLILSVKLKEPILLALACKISLVLRLTVDQNVLVIVNVLSIWRASIINARTHA